MYTVKIEAKEPEINLEAKCFSIEDARAYVASSINSLFEKKSISSITVNIEKERRAGMLDVRIV
jgi:hypothetical protein